MNANAPVVPKKKKARKPPNAKRLAAEQALANAKSDQEKALARSQAKLVRFEDLARARVRRALKVLSGIENLANRAAYSWTEEQAAKVLNALNDAMKKVTLKFAGGSQKKEEFDL
jgi:hypothetical protein